MMWKRGSLEGGSEVVGEVAAERRMDRKWAIASWVVRIGCVMLISRLA